MKIYKTNETKVFDLWRIYLRGNSGVVHNNYKTFYVILNGTWSEMLVYVSILFDQSLATEQLSEKECCL